MNNGKPKANKVSGEKMVVYLVVLQGPRVKRPAQKKFSNHTA